MELSIQFFYLQTFKFLLRFQYLSIKWSSLIADTTKYMFINNIKVFRIESLDHLSFKYSSIVINKLTFLILRVKL